MGRDRINVINKGITKLKNKKVTKVNNEGSFFKVEVRKIYRGAIVKEQQIYCVQNKTGKNVLVAKRILNSKGEIISDNKIKMAGINIPEPDDIPTRPRHRARIIHKHGTNVSKVHKGKLHGKK